MKRVFVFEYLTAGGAVDGGEEALRTLLAPGLHMRDAMVGDLLAADAVDVTVAVCDRVPMPPPAPGVRPCAPLPGETLVDMVARQARTHDAVWLVAPETGGLLAAFCRAVPAPRWLGCGIDAIVLASSKRATLERLSGRGIATPLACAASATAWIVKPDDGAGAVDTVVHHDPAAARAAAGPGMTLEPWVDGDAMSLSLLCAGGAAERLSVNRQHVAVDAAGRVVYDGVEVDRRPRSRATDDMLADLGVRVARAIPGLWGFVGIDIVWHAQRGPVVIEVNPRVTCAYAGLSQHLSRNLAAEMLALRRG